jgi:hypothetical protein
MLLANAARYLAGAGKGVVALDFDFEAPGLHYKFFGEREVAGGAVPYLLATAEGTVSPPPFDDHMISVPVSTESGGWLRLMPAGPAPHQSYWAALKQLGERLRLTDLSGRGFMALLDLQARIADELKPDYLLIDARTGVTELGGLATTVLADTVVCMFAVNLESLDGTLTVIEAIYSAPRLANQKPIRIVPVVSRTTTKLLQEGWIPSGPTRLGARLEATRGPGPMFFTLPHDDEFGSFEGHLKGEQETNASSQLYKAYIELFKELFPGLRPSVG